MASPYGTLHPTGQRISGVIHRLSQWSDRTKRNRSHLHVYHYSTNILVPLVNLFVKRWNNCMKNGAQCVVCCLARVRSFVLPSLYPCSGSLACHSAALTTAPSALRRATANAALEKRKDAKMKIDHRSLVQHETNTMDNMVNAYF